LHNSIVPERSTIGAPDGSGTTSASILLPSIDEAAAFPWSAAIARQRGVYGFNSMDARSRSFNMLRGRLVSLRQDRKWRALGIVSATPNVGKSFVSASLAASMSRDPRFQTYLVDLDLRRGRLKDIFGIDTQGSIGEFLEAEGPRAELAAFRPVGEKLIVFPNIPGNVRSAEVLAGPRMTEFMQVVRGSSDRNFFLFDLPPVYANDDAATVIDQLDGYIFIAEEGTTTQQEVESAIDLLGLDKLAGVVLNKYRGGLLSEGTGMEDRYASEYYALDPEDDA
jgi:protein-tyrosine kinase